MTSIKNDAKQPIISKKWLYGSLAVIALIIGLVVDKEAIAAEDDSTINTVEQVNIDNEDGEIAIDISMENDDFEGDDYAEEDE